MSGFGDDLDDWLSQRGGGVSAPSSGGEFGDLDSWLAQRNKPAEPAPSKDFGDLDSWLDRTGRTALDVAAQGMGQVQNIFDEPVGRFETKDQEKKRYAAMSREEKDAYLDQRDPIAKHVSARESFVGPRERESLRAKPVGETMFANKSGARNLSEAERALSEYLANGGEISRKRHSNPLGEAIIEKAGRSLDGSPLEPFGQMAMGAFDVASRLSRDQFYEPIKSGLEEVERSSAEGEGALGALVSGLGSAGGEFARRLGERKDLREGQTIGEAAGQDLKRGELAPLPDGVLDWVANNRRVKRTPEFDRMVSALAWEVGLDGLNLLDGAALLKLGKRIDQIASPSAAFRAERNAESLLGDWNARDARGRGVAPENQTFLGNEISQPRAEEAFAVPEVREGLGRQLTPEQEGELLRADISRLAEEPLPSPKWDRDFRELDDPLAHLRRGAEDARTPLDDYIESRLPEQEAEIQGQIMRDRWEEIANEPLANPRWDREFREYQDPLAHLRQGAEDARTPLDEYRDAYRDSRLFEEETRNRLLSEDPPRIDFDAAPRPLDPLLQREGRLRTQQEIHGPSYQEFADDPSIRSHRIQQENAERMALEDRASRLGQDLSPEISPDERLRNLAKEEVQEAPRLEVASARAEIEPDLLRPEGEMSGAGRMDETPGPSRREVSAAEDYSSWKSKPLSTERTPDWVPISSTPGETIPKIKNLQEISRDLQKILDKATRTRVTYGIPGSRPKGMLGSFHNERNLIEVGGAGEDLGTLTHEMTHALDRHFGILKTDDQGLLRELATLADPGRPGSISSFSPGQGLKRQKQEGLSEFVREWFENPAQAAKEFPRSHQAWDGFLKSLGGPGRDIRKARLDYQTWKSSPPAARISSMIKFSSDIETRITANDAIQGLWDQFRSIEVLTEMTEAARGRRLNPDDDPYLLARFVNSSDSKTKYFLEKGVLRWSDNSVVEGVKAPEQILSVLKDPVDQQDFWNYMVAKRVRDRYHDHGLPSGFTAADVDNAINFRQGKFTNHDFAAMSTDLYKWSDAVLQYGIEGGLITKAQAKGMRELNSSYIPLKRVMEANANEVAEAYRMSGRSLRGKSPVKKVTGSKREIIHPLESLVENAALIVRETQKNAVGQSLLRLWDENTPGVGTGLRDVSRRNPMAGVVKDVSEDFKHLDVSEARGKLEAAGVERGVIDDDLLTVLGASDKSKKKQAKLPENVIRVVDPEGNVRHLQLHPSLYKAYTANDQAALKIYEGFIGRYVMNPIDWSNNALRKGAISYNPVFPMFNFFRDAMGAGVVSRFGTNPIKRSVEGIYTYFRRPEIVDEWIRNGGQQGLDEFLRGPEAYERKAKQISGQIKEGALKQGVNHFLGRLEQFAQASDDFTRLGEYMSAKRHLKAMSEAQGLGWTEAQINKRAAFESRDLMDFSVRGSHQGVQLARRLVPFLGSGLTGNYRAARALFSSDIPGKALGFPGKESWRGIAAGTVYLTVPTLGLYLINRGRPGYWQIPQEQRDRFWHIPIPGTEDFMRIPKPFIIGTMFASIPERILSWTDANDPQSFVGLASQILKDLNLPDLEPLARDGDVGKTAMSFTNYLPTAAKVGLEVAFNRNTFKGKPIDYKKAFKRPDQETPAFMRSTRYNSATTKALSQVFYRMGIKLSAPELEHIAQGLIGTTARNVQYGIDVKLPESMGGYGFRTPGTDDIVSPMTGIEGPDRKPREALGFVATPYKSEAEDRLVKALSELRESKKAAEGGIGRFKDGRTLSKLEAAAKQVKRQQKIAREGKTKELRERARKRAASIAEKYLRGTKWRLGKVG